MQHLKKMKCSRIGCLWVLLVLFPLTASAEWQAAASLSSSVESNALRNYTSYSDIVTEGSLSVAHQWNWPSWRGSLSYTLNAISFADLAEYNYHLHTFGATAEHQLVHDGWLRGGVQAKMRIDREIYNLLDYREFEAFFEAKIPHEKPLSAFAGYTLRKRHYIMLDELDNWEHLVYGRLNLPFSDGTTVNLLSEVGYKNYVMPIASSSSSNGAGVGQWVTTARLSRPIAERLGLMVYARSRINFGDDELFVSGLSTNHISENDLYDDRYSYESREYGAMISRQLPHAVTLRAGYDYADKRFQQPALDLAGNALPNANARTDKESRWWCKVEKRFTSAGNIPFNLYAKYQWMQNDSNDEYYQYRASAVIAGVDVAF